MTDAHGRVEGRTEAPETKIDLDEILDDILESEGGFVDHPNDRGGPTNFGITMGALSDFEGRPVTPGEIRALTKQQARDVYRSMYINKPGFGVIGSQRLLSLVVDMAVNHGISRATKILQRALGVTEDGIFGPKTREALRATDYGQLYLKTCAERIRFRGRIITADPSQAVFAAGWLNRDARFVEKA